ncbi:MAG: arsenate reductase (glutaredoxin) [Flavobacteriaceae bacterium]
MIKIYHNNRCSKSRCALEILEKSGNEFQIIKYLENTPTKKELLEVIKLLGITPLELIRKNEAIWKENFKGKSLTNEALVDAMLQFPKLIERPIVIHNNKAVICRPPEKILEIL